MWQIAVGLGLGYLCAARGYLFAADRVAKSIGWPVGVCFSEKSVYGMQPRYRRAALHEIPRYGFRVATVPGIGIVSVAYGHGHVDEMVVQGNYAPTNAGPVM